VNLTGDEVGLYVPALGATSYTLCPFQFRTDLPMDLYQGAGVVIYELTGEPSSMCVPAGTAAQQLGCYIHEPGSTTDTLLGFYTPSPAATASSYKIPCPNISFPVTASYTALPAKSAVGPIIGASGGVQP
jgi:hypothetical protein